MSFIRENLELMTRDQGQRIVRREGFWWMDLKKDEEWYADPLLESQIRRLGEVHRAHYHRPPSIYRPEIAVVVDEQSLFHTAVGDRLREQESLLIRNTLPYLGAPYDILLLDDVIQPETRDYKLYIILDAIRVDQQQRTDLHARLKQAGATAVWHWLPGILDENDCGIEHSSQLTGITLKMLGGQDVSEPRFLTARFSTFSHPATRGIPPSHILGGVRLSGYAFIDDDQAETLARISAKARPGYGIKPARSPYASSGLEMINLWSMPSAEIATPSKTAA